jgi:hypothetical protein
MRSRSIAAGKQDMHQLRAQFHRVLCDGRHGLEKDVFLVFLLGRSLHGKLSIPVLLQRKPYKVIDKVMDNTA